MSDGDRTAIGKVEQWARWTFWPASILTVVCLAMLYWGAEGTTWKWFLPVYLLVGMPTIVESLASDFTRLRDLWRSRKDGGGDRL